MNASDQRAASPPTASPHCPIVIGVGSPHAQDRIGWDVIDRLQQIPELKELGTFHKAAVPHNTLDWLDVTHTTHIVDAIVSSAHQPMRLAIFPGPLGNLQANVTNEQGVEQACEFPKLRSNSTHQFDLLSVLQLAGVLGRLPTSLVLWAIPVCPPQPQHFSQSPPWEPDTEQPLVQCVEQIYQELIHA